MRTRWIGPAAVSAAVGLAAVAAATVGLTTAAADAAAAGGTPAATAPGPRTGEFTVTFDERSPLTAPKSIAPRLGRKEKDLAPDYDLSKEPFVLYVPEDYDPAKPVGLVVLLNYKASTEAPKPVLPTFKDRRLIFAAVQNVGQPDWARCGLAVDAVHNLRKRYAVDDARVYLLAHESRGPSGDVSTGGQLAALAFADVFTGSCHVHGLVPWRQLRVGNTQSTYAARGPTLPPAGVAKARTRPTVVGTPSDPPRQDGTDFAKFLRADGFRLVKLMKITTDQAHYPIYTTDWLGDVIGYWDQATDAARAAAKPAALTKPAATRPATRPAARPR